MTSVAAGDRAAFRALHQRHHGLVFRLAYGVLLSRDDAHDVAQDVFVKLLAAAPTWPAARPVSAWLHRVTMNEALSMKRRLQRATRRWVSGSQPLRLPDVEISVHQAVAATQKAISRLAPRQRAVVTLSLEADLPPSDIAAVLDITPNTARVTLHQALTRLRAAMSAQGVELPLLDGDPALALNALEELDDA